MAFETAQTEWVASLATQAKVQQALQKRRNEKDAILQRLSTRISEARDEILLKIKEMEVSDGTNVMQVLDYLSRDQTTEFDLADQVDGFGLSEEAQKKLTEIGVLLDVLAKGFDAKVKKLDPDGNELPEEEPLFTSEDLKKELYQPIVRQGLMSETFVPEEFSETAELLKNSFQLYKERLDEEGVEGRFRENFDLALTFAQSGVSIVESGFSLASINSDPSSWKPSLDFFDEVAKSDPGAICEVIGMGLEVVSQTLEGYDDVSESLASSRQLLLEEEGPVEEDDEIGLKRAQARRVVNSPKVAPRLIAAVATSLSGKMNEDNWGLGPTASAAYSSSVNPSKIAKELAANPLAETNVNAVRDLLKAGLPIAINTCDPGLPADLTEGLPESDKIMAEAGQAMADKFATEFATSAILTALQKEAYGDVNKAISQAADAAVMEGKGKPNFQKLLDNQDKRGKVIEQAGNKIAQEFLRELEEDEKKIKNELASLENIQENEQLASKLAARIKEMERHELLVKWAANIAGLGVDVASKFIAPLAIAGNALSLAQNIIKAVKRTQDWRNFYASKMDLFAAASPYSAPVANFHYNARQQAIHYQINAALDLVNMIGAVMETVGAAAFGIGVAVGKAMQGAATAAEALEAVLFALKNRYDLEKAWATYKIALERPDNRRLGLIAMKKNPTLAKYAVAWGAVVKKDALVGDFLDRCQLTAEELEDPKLKVGEVQRYLELRMPDDNVVVGREVFKSGWQPEDGQIQLTAASWMGAKKLGEQNAELEPQDTRDVEVALLAYDKFNKELTTTSSPVKQDYEKVVPPLKDAVTAINSYRPRRKNQTSDHVEMRSVVDRFRQKVVARQNELEQTIKTL